MYSPKTRVLVIDPEGALTRLMRMILERTGDFEVMEANRGEFALLAARFFRPDIILLHPLIGRGNGFDLAMQLRGKLPRDTARIVFLTRAVRAAILRTSSAAVVPTGLLAGRDHARVQCA